MAPKGGEGAHHTPSPQLPQLESGDPRLVLFPASQGCLEASVEEALYGVLGAFRHTTNAGWLMLSGFPEPLSVYMKFMDSVDTTCISY